MLLGLLSTEDMYGYQMSQELAKRSNEAFDFKEGTLYPILYELEKTRLFEAYWEDTTLRRKRKYYHIATAGLVKFNEKRRDWHDVVSAVAVFRFARQYEYEHQPLPPDTRPDHAVGILRHTDRATALSDEIAG